MRRPRWTTRRIMAAVAGLAVVLGLGLPAVEVARDGRGHDHTWEQTEEEIRASETRSGTPLPRGIGLIGWNAYETPPFWHRYRRRLLGLPPGPCREAMTHPGESCSFRPPP